MVGVFEYAPIAIISDSMNPVINRGDVVIYKKLNQEELSKLSKNDIVVYNLEGKNIAHRIIKKIRSKNLVFYRTKGDRNNIIDKDLVEDDSIKGKCIFCIKYVGFPSIWLYEFLNKGNLEEEEFY